MPSVVPALGTEIQALVVTLPDLLDQAFEAQEAADAVVVLVESQEGQQAGHAPVAVPEWMDAEKVQHECGDGDQRWDVVLVERVPVAVAELLHRGRCIRGWHATEPHHRSASGLQLDDVVVDTLELPGVATGGLAEGMQAQQGVRSDGRVGVAGVDLIQRTAIALHLLFGPIARIRPAQDQRVQALATDRHAFDAIRGLGTLDDGGVTEGLEDLW